MKTNIGTIICDNCNVPLYNYDKNRLKKSKVIHSNLFRVIPLISLMYNIQAPKPGDEVRCPLCGRGLLLVMSKEKHKVDKEK